MKSRDYHDVIFFEKLRFQNVFHSHENEKPAISNSSGLKSVFVGRPSFTNVLRVVWTRLYFYSYLLNDESPNWINNYNALDEKQPQLDLKDLRVMGIKHIRIYLL